MGIKVIAFDVANTLLHKSDIYEVFEVCFREKRIEVPKEVIKQYHHILRENTDFPDVTNKEFYYHFNKSVCHSLGIDASDELLASIYEGCKKVGWKVYNDVNAIQNISLPKVIFSNFNANLESLINEKIGNVFDLYVVSETIGLSKPSIAFYEKAIEMTGYRTDEILYVGDCFRLDYKPAISLGIKTLLIDRDGFFPGCTDRISSLDEIKNYLN